MLWQIKMHIYFNYAIMWRSSNSVILLEWVYVKCFNENWIMNLFADKEKKVCSHRHLVIMLPIPTVTRPNKKQKSYKRVSTNQHNWTNIVKACEMKCVDKFSIYTQQYYSVIIQCITRIKRDIQVYPYQLYSTWWLSLE